MNFPDPTPLKIGMTGTLVGKSFRVAGRVVMGMQEEGETYYWHEYHLVAGESETATLVYEETERRGQWKMFVLFEPQHPMTAAEAATRRVGDKVSIDGKAARVMLVDESRVYQMDGKPPEGIAVGDVEHYFNAQAGRDMLVVSWAGDEVEYYRGMDLPRGAVESAFNLPRQGSTARRAAPGQSGRRDNSGSRTFLIAAAVLLLAAAAWATFSFVSPKSSRAITKSPAPASLLKLGDTGKLNGVNYRVVGHAVVEIAGVGLLFERHEYYLRDEKEHSALLVGGLKPNGKIWALFTAVEPRVPMTPRQAAVKKLGDLLEFDGRAAPIHELFQCTIRQLELEKPESAPEEKTGEVLFGCAAQSGATPMLARWNESGLLLYRGEILPTGDVTAAFGVKAPKR
jgi:hypothetical protein